MAHDLTPSGQPLQVAVPRTASLHGILSGLEFHTHALHAEVSAIRAIPQVAAEVEDGIEAEVDIMHEGRPAAVGFTAEVDAVRLLVRSSAIPEQLTPAARRAAWTAWFERAVLDDPYLGSHSSRFSVGWLVVLYLASLASVAIGEQLKTLAQPFGACATSGCSDACFAPSRPCSPSTPMMTTSRAAPRAYAH